MSHQFVKKWLTECDDVVKCSTVCTLDGAVPQAHMVEHRPFVLLDKSSVLQLPLHSPVNGRRKNSIEALHQFSVMRSGLSATKQTKYIGCPTYSDHSALLLDCNRGKGNQNKPISAIWQFSTPSHLDS